MLDNLFEIMIIFVRLDNIGKIGSQFTCILPEHSHDDPDPNNIFGIKLSISHKNHHIHIKPSNISIITHNIPNKISEKTQIFIIFLLYDWSNRLVNERVYVLLELELVWGAWLWEEGEG